MPDLKALSISALRALGMAAAVVGGLSLLYAVFEKNLMANRWIDAVSVVMLFASVGILYLVLAWVCRASEFAELFAVIRKRKK